MPHKWTRRKFLTAIPLLLWMVRSGARATPKATEGRAKSLLDREVAQTYLHNAWARVILRWSELGTAEERAKAFKAVVNEALKSVGVPPVDYKVIAVGKPLWAEFATKRWKLHLDPERLSVQALSEVDALSFVAIIYHEARHAEQAYLIVRTLAGQGRKTVKAIQQRYIIAKLATISAIEHPLPKRSPRARQASEWLKDIVKNYKDPPKAKLLQAQAALDEAQVKSDAIAQDPRVSEKKREKAEKRLTEVHAQLESAQGRYNTQLIEGDAKTAFDLIVSIWREERTQ